MLKQKNPFFIQKIVCIFGKPSSFIIIREGAVEIVMMKGESLETCQSCMCSTQLIHTLKQKKKGKKPSFQLSTPPRECVSWKKNE